METTELIHELERRMGKAILALREEFGGLRTGRASTSLLEDLSITLYGSTMHLKQLATLNVPEMRMITVQPWDKTALATIEKTIRDSDLGLNPIRDGNILRVPIPELTETRRREIVKVVHKYAEQSKVAIRNIRREGIEQLKKMEKGKELSKDELQTLEKNVQTVTDRFTKEVDDLAHNKEAEVMKV